MLALGLALAGVLSEPARAASVAGSMLAWGVNGSGELGNNNTGTNSPVPVAVFDGAIPPATTITQVAYGNGDSLALSSTGQMYAWGANGAGQLGDGSTGSNSPVPVAVAQGAIPPGTRITQIAAGNTFCLALSSTGQVYAWGYNGDGELGDDKAEPLSPFPVAVLGGAIPPGTTITQIASGADYSLALGSTGQVYAWGANSAGQLGNNHTGTNAPLPVAVAQGAIPPGNRTTQITAGGGNGLALGSNGLMYAWGFNGNGELGNNNAPTSSPAPVGVLQGAIPPDTTITQIASGQDHSLALSSTGHIYAWGANGAGQLGNNNAPHSSPVPVAVSQGTIPPGTTITQIATGNSHSLALSSTGQLYAWGDDLYGELGNNTTTSSPVPAPVAVDLPVGTTIELLARGPESQHSLAVVGNLSVATSSLPAATANAPYSATLTGAGGLPPYHWTATGLAPGLTLDPASGAIAGTPTTPGNYTAAITLSDAHGLTTSASLALSVAAQAVSTPPLNTNPGATLAVPVITAIGQSNSVWREGNGLATFSGTTRRHLVGTTFSFALNERASVSFSFTQRLPGRKVAGSCVTPTSRNRHRHPCERSVTQGTLSFPGHAGLNKVSFQGRISASRKLRPGRYTLVIAATNAAGLRSLPATLVFTIVTK
jgi:alpha-tubulin suppressor-like RCC1 family protein